MAYQHVDMETLQESKRAGEPCGDSTWVWRSPFHTSFVLADGIGSGVRAHIASQMNTARLAGLLKDGASPRDAFQSLAATLSGWRDHSLPFAAFLLGRIQNNGRASVLAYEMPAPLLLSRREARLLEGAPLVVPAGLACEYQCRVEPGDGLLCVSDGISQAGIGGVLSQGWTGEDLEGFLNEWQRLNRPYAAVARDVMDQARDYDGPLAGDDKTVMLAHARRGSVVRLLTGPPRDRAQDARVCADFLEAEGAKVLCGATTSEIVSRESGQVLEMEQDFGDAVTPPRSSMQGVDLVCEGVITLTQVYNVLDEGLGAHEDHSAATELAGLLLAADKVHFTVGGALNPANRDIAFRKQGILARATVVPLIAEKLERMGKLVTVERI